MFQLYKLFLGGYRDEAGGEGATGGGGEGDWREGLSEEIRSSAALEDIKDVNALASSYINTKSMVGSSIRIPGEDASDEARTEFNTKLLESAPNLMIKPDFDNAEQSTEFFRTIGAPEESSGYEFPEIENGVTVPEDRQNLIKDAALKVGITKKQFGNVMEVIANADAEMMAAQTEATNAAMGELKTEWGVAFDERMNAAKDIAGKTGAPAGLLEAIKANQVSPDVFKWLHSLSEQFGPEGNNANLQDGGGSSAKLTPAEAQAKIDDIMGNPKHAYFNSTDPAHQRAMKEMVELVTFANPGISTNVDDLRAGGMAIR